MEWKRGVGEGTNGAKLKFEEQSKHVYLYVNQNNAPHIKH